MNYRVAKIEDVAELCELLNQLFSQEVEFIPDKENQTIGLTKIISNENLGEIFVALEDEKIVAMVNILYTISTALGKKVAILEDMIVDENYRGQNIGSLLMEFALAEIARNGCKRVTLLTDVDNLQAHKFYENKGFAKSSMIPFRKIL